MKRYLIQHLDEEGRVNRTRAFPTRENRDAALLSAYLAFHRRHWKNDENARLRDPDGYEVSSEDWHP